MTDVHCHVSAGDPSVREFRIGRDFLGLHPWETLTRSPEDLRAAVEDLRRALTADAALGVGEIGLDRLKERTVSPVMREVFETQLQLAVALKRPVVLHGAKCWGQVVEALRRTAGAAEPPPSLFHGFSRSDGLLPEIVALNGYVSVGPAVLNDHAVNYRELVRKIPLERLLVETDRTETSEPVSVRDVLAKLAELRGLTTSELEAATDANATRFLGREAKDPQSIVAG